MVLSGVYLPLSIVRQGDPGLAQIFQDILIDDSIPGETTLRDYLNKFGLSLVRLPK